MRWILWIARQVSPEAYDTSFCIFHHQQLSRWLEDYTEKSMVQMVERLEEFYPEKMRLNFQRVIVKLLIENG